MLFVNNSFENSVENFLVGECGEFKKFLLPLRRNLKKDKDNLMFSRMVSTFIGNTEVRLDEKGRMFIPANYRKILQQMRSERIVMRRDTDNACLIMYPEEVWNRKVEELSRALNEWDAGDQMILMQFVADAEYLEPDSQGRILLQKRNLQQIGASGDMLIVGLMNRFAVWDKQMFEQKRISQKDLAEMIREKMTTRVKNEE